MSCELCAVNREQDSRLPAVHSSELATRSSTHVPDAHPILLGDAPSPS
jgi:hypothetical protein